MVVIKSTISIAESQLKAMMLVLKKIEADAYKGKIQAKGIYN